MAAEKIELIGLSKAEIEERLAALGEKPFRAKQVWHWLYHQGVTEFEKMTSLSKDLRQKLAENFTVTRPKIVTEQLSSDKTHKWLLEYADGQRIETVYIPEEDRGTICISTQVGCAVGCTFCHTGSQKITRNLTAGEIVSQFLVARDAYNEWPTPVDETRYLSNIVVMGMGEPLHNIDNVVKALKILSDGEGVAVSRRKITLSTSGIAPHIAPVIKEIGCKLAISLHAPNNELRSRIMPINKRYPIEEIRTIADNNPFITAVDEAYSDFADGFVSAMTLIESNPRVAVLKTFSKAYGKAGARLGLLVSHPDIQKAFMKLKAPYNVSLLSQREGLEALSDEGFDARVNDIVRRRNEFSRYLETLPYVIKVYPSEANFILIRVPDAAALYDYLLSLGIVVRNRSSEPLLENTLRITIGSEDEMRTLKEALDAYKG